MDRTPDVSVVMANYNGAAYLAQAIRSVQAQTLASWELIVVDDASTDDSVPLAQAFALQDPRIKVLVQPGNSGPAAARNRALDAAKGAWIAVFDSDDVMAADRLERLLARAGATNADIVADNQLICSQALIPERQYLSGEALTRLTRIDVVLFIETGRLYSSLPDLGFLKPMISSALIARSGARYDETLRIAEDFHFLLDLLVRGAELQIEPAPLYLYRKHPASISHRLSPQAQSAMIAADDAFRRRLDPVSPAARAMGRRIEGLKSQAMTERAIGAFKEGRRLQALGLALCRPHAWRLMSRPLVARIGRAASAAVLGRRGATDTAAGGKQRSVQGQL